MALSSADVALDQRTLG